MGRKQCQPRLAEDVTIAVKVSSKKNVRTLAGEVNYALRKYYDIENGEVRDAIRKLPAAIRLPRPIA